MLKLRNVVIKNVCLKKEYKEVMLVLIEILKERFFRLKWKEENVDDYDVV